MICKVRKRIGSTLVLLGLLGVAALPWCNHAGEPRETTVQRDARMAWWRDARFGMFIHWDMSSIAGTEISWSRKATRPLDVDGHPAGYVEDPVYDQLYQKFNPTNFNAAAWVALAKEAGMKYIVFTAKHHGGFCMWDTRFTDYSIMHTPFKRDVVRELSEACHAAGLRFGLYYSPRDWHHPDYGIGDNAKYHDYLKGQLTELLTHYGRVDVFWFDSFGKGDSIHYWHADEILALVRRLQPGIIINNRCSYFGEQVPSLAADFDTPEQEIGRFQNTRAWESCMCLLNAPNGGWSYRTDGHVKSLSDCLRMLVSCATGDGNLLLDVGPDPTGVIPADQSGRLREMGEWLRRHGDSIYGTRGGPFVNGKWGGSTQRGNKIWLHVFEWSDGDTLQLPPFGGAVLSALAYDGAKPKVAQTPNGLEVKLAAEQQTPVDTVIALTLAAGTAKVDLLADKRIMVLGDSITQNGAYVSFLEYFLQKAYPARQFDIVSVGLGSETTSGLSEPGHAGGAFPRPCVHERLQRALATVNPNVVMACYGMNDGIYQPLNDERMKAFQDGITKLAGDCQAAGAKVILVTPPVFDARTATGWNYDETLRQFTEWEVKHPPPGVVAVADLHTAMAAALAERQRADTNYHFSADSVHPGELGHLVMARAILEGLEVPMPLGGAEELLTAANADPLFKLVCRHREIRSAGWLDYIGYTRDRKVAPGTGNINEIETNAGQIQQQIDALKPKDPPLLR